MSTDAASIHQVAAGLFEAAIIRLTGALVVIEGEITCRQLETPAGFLTLHVGDRVLVSRHVEKRYGVILGRVAMAREPAPDLHQPDQPVPEELVLSARRQLVLRCSEGEIILRGDGKVIIRGTDLVAKAKRANCIKGGQVVIN